MQPKIVAGRSLDGEGRAAQTEGRRHRLYRRRQRTDFAARLMQRRGAEMCRRLDIFRLDALEIERFGRGQTLQAAHDFTLVCSVWYLNCLRASSSRMPPRTASRIAFSAFSISSAAASTLSSCSLGITT